MVAEGGEEFVGHREVPDELGSPLLGPADVGTGLGSDVCTSNRLVGGVQRVDDGEEFRHLLDRDPEGLHPADDRQPR
jgi:hypothetical protein